MNNPAANDNFMEGPDEPTPPTATRSYANATLIQDCCLEAMKAIPARSVHLILADLPYGTTACSWDSIIDLEKLWAEYERIITPTGVIVLTAAQPFTTILATSKLAWLKESLVWEKTRATGFLQSKKRHLKKHEDILVFSPGTVVSGKGRQTARNMTYNPQGLVELERPVRSRNGNMKGGTLSYSGSHNSLSPIYRPCYTKPNTKQNGEAVTFNGKPITGDGRNQTHTNYPTSILRFASERKTVHPTQKPVALMEYLIRTYSNDGDTVLDNVMGSGTTGVACANVGNRHFIGIERDQKYFAIAEARIAAAHDQAPEAPPVPMAANDDAPAVGTDEHDEIVARVQAIMAAPKRRKAVKVPAWKVRNEVRRQTRKDARRVARQASRAERMSGANHDVVAAENDNIPAMDFDREGVTVPSDRAVAVLPMLAAVNDATPRVADAEEGEVATAAPAHTPPERHLTVNENGITTSVTFHQGDCLQAMRGMADGSVDVVVTSPPYNLGTSTGNGFRYGKSGGKWKNAALQDGYASYSDDMPDEAYVEWLKAVISECWRLIPDDGAIFFNHKPRVQGGVCLLPTRFLPPEVILRQEIIWARSGGLNFNQSFFLPTHERVLVLAKPKFRLKKGASGIGDVWTIPQERKNKHPAPFPLELPRRCVAATNATVIFDPFLGSGTTGVAAQLEGRDFIGCELDPGYLEMARQRLGVVAAQPQPPTLEVVSERQTPPPIDAANDHDVIRYATICSGIEGVSAAVEPLGGFKAEFFSDKAKYSRFAAEFLKWKFPHVPYIDDFTTIDGAAHRGKIDVLWGSTPCQTWSKAGKNAGFADDRGQLTLNFINLVNKIQPQFTIWENVKNVLSHKEAFSQFLGTLAGEDCKLLPAGKKWENAGYVRGPERQIAWRVFDAEYAGLAARRERLFLVATPVGGADPRDILWERDYPEIGGRHPEAGRRAWERIEGEKVRLRAAGGRAGGSDGPFAFNADTSPKSSETGLTLRADTASGGFQGIALRDENGPRAFRLTPEMMERMLGFPAGWTDMGDAWTGRGRLDIRRRAALGNSLAVPDVRWILDRVKASVQGALELHHWPEPDWAANDNSAEEGTVKAAMRKPQSVGGARRWKSRDDDFGLGEAKLKSQPKENLHWVA